MIHQVSCSSTSQFRRPQQSFRHVFFCFGHIGSLRLKKQVFKEHQQCGRASTQHVVKQLTISIYLEIPRLWISDIESFAKQCVWQLCAVYQKGCIQTSYFRNLSFPNHYSIVYTRGKCTIPLSCKPNVLSTTKFH